MELVADGERTELRAPISMEEPKLPPVVTQETVAWSFLQWLLNATQRQIKIEGRGISPKEVFVPRLYSFDRMGFTKTS